MLKEEKLLEIEKNHLKALNFLEDFNKFKEELKEILRKGIITEDDIDLKSLLEDDKPDHLN